MPKRMEHYGVAFIVAGVLLLLVLLLGCRPEPPRAEVMVVGTEVLPVPSPNVRVYVVHDTARAATCWVGVATTSGGPQIALSCLHDEATPLTQSAVVPTLPPVPK